MLIHRWMPLGEASVESLPRYLKDKQAEGWVLVGLEQSSDSVPLHKYTFPPKVVLLLGKEKVCELQR
jgi:tRNA guanosine-2'-O-methyltransferase